MDMERVHAVVRLTREGKTLREMSEILGVSDTRLGVARAWAVENGLFPDYAGWAAAHRAPWSRIRELFAAGATIAEVAEEFDCSIERVRRWRVEMRRRGELPGFKAKSMYRRAEIMMRNRGEVVGSLKHCLDSLPKEVVNWLVRETPSEARLSDTIAAIIKDAYYEETGKETGG